MPTAHKTILAALLAHKGKGTTHSSNDRYLKSGHIYHDVSVPIRRQIAKEWLKANQDISDEEFTAALDGLYRGKSHEEKTVASILLGYRSGGRRAASLGQIDGWLDHLAGWAEIDALCGGNFTAAEMLYHWKQWEHFLRKLAKSKNENKRRAALVFLVGPVGASSDKRILTLAFELIDTLKHEKDIIITKAISWLLRSAVKRHKKAVSAYIARNRDTLPKIAVRETIKKIETGRK